MKQENIGYIDLEKLDRELKEFDSNIKSVEEEGIKNTLKHFDRLHDKLFNFNNLLIAGYFALARFDSTISYKNILFPLGNMVLLIWIEYKMMAKSRIDSKIKTISKTEIEIWKNKTLNINLYSLLIIGSTLIVTALFLFYLLK